MNLNIRAHVWREPIHLQNHAHPWNVQATATDAETHRIHTIESTGRPAALEDVAPSWPEAMQAAYKLTTDLDHQLMNEVHESRAARRAAMDRHPAGKARQEPTS